MDRKEIAKTASQMKSKEDLLSLLNRIKQAALEEIGLQDQFHPFTMKHINYYCNPNNAFHRYTQFKVKKKSGGFRLITSPRNRSFMMMLSALNELLKSLYTPSDYAMGFAEGCSVVSNANIHKGQNYVFNIDLKDFFPSIEQPRVWKRLQLTPFNFPEKIASLIAGMCSMKETRAYEDGRQETFFVLPQGAPTSPIITNMICDTLDRRLAGLAKRFGLHYSRYADDITFSSMHHVYQKNGEFRKELRRIITDQHFTINDDKTRLQKKGDRQEVTGIIVSEKLNVTQKYVRDVRNILYIWNRYGYPSALAKFIPKYKNVTYIETWALLEFEKKHSTEVVITTSENSHRYAHFIFGGKNAKASVNKNITPDEEKDKKHLAISLCIDEKGDTFWLVHTIDKIIVPKKKEVDIDELNRNLDLLLSM